MKQATAKTFPQPNRAGRRAATYAARSQARPATAKDDPGLRRYFASCISVRSISCDDDYTSALDEDDLGTVRRLEIDACLQKNLVVGVSDGEPTINFRTKQARDLAAEHGLIVRHGFPGDGHQDVYVPPVRLTERERHVTLGRTRGCTPPAARCPRRSTIVR